MSEARSGSPQSSPVSPTPQKPESQPPRELVGSRLPGSATGSTGQRLPSTQHRKVKCVSRSELVRTWKLRPCNGDHNRGLAEGLGRLTTVESTGAATLIALLSRETSLLKGGVFRCQDTSRTQPASMRTSFKKLTLGPSWPALSLTGGSTL